MQDRPRWNVTRAAALYFALVFGAGFVMGPIRVLWLEPALGVTSAVILEAPFLVLAMVFAARWAIEWARLSGGAPSFLAVGLLALSAQLAADLAVGMGLRGMTLRDELAYFASPPGFVYVAALIVFMLMPAFVGLQQRRRIGP